MLVLSLIWAWTTWNLYHPWRGKPEFMGVVSFALGLLRGELPLHIIALEFLLTLLIIAVDGLEGIADALALMIALGAWIGTAWYFWRCHGAADDMEKGIVEALGPDYAAIIPAARAEGYATAIDYSKLINPFAYQQPGVKRVRNIVYHTPEGAMDLRLDIFHNEKMPQNAPVLMQIHGGAWLENVGNKDQQALPLMAQLAQHGWVCVTVQYRLSPSVALPMHIIDCKRALVWIKENIRQFGGDPDFIIATGGSAGGHLCALLALSANDPELQPGFEDADTRVQGCVPFYGIFDFTNCRGQRRHQGLENVLARRVMQVTRYENLELWQKCSPLFRVTETAPPFLIIHGDADTLAPVEESRELIEELRKHPGVQAGLAKIRGAQHGFDLMVSLRNLHTINGVERFGTALHERYLHAQIPTLSTGRL